MTMRDWHDDWKILVLTQEVPKGTEVDVGKTKTPAGDKVAPKRSKPTWKPTKKKEGVPKKYAQEGNKDTAPQQKEQGEGATKTQGTPSTYTPEE
jgi:hypothetical protein